VEPSSRHLPVCPADGCTAAAAEHVLAVDDHPQPVRDQAAHQPGEQTLEAHALRFGFYSLLQAAAAAVFLAMLHHMVSRDQVPGIPPQVVTDNDWQSYGLLLGFGLSIPLFFLVTYGWVLWVVVPALGSWLYRHRHRTPHG
jgi:hypothetical protein